MRPKEFEARVKASVKELQDPKAVLQKAAFIVQRSAQANAPVRTGNLRRSITTRIEGHAAYVGTAVEYAPYVEYGTKYMPARPFLGKALEDNKPQIEQMLAQFGELVFKRIATGPQGGGDITQPEPGEEDDGGSGGGPE